MGKAYRLLPQAFGDARPAFKTLRDPASNSLVTSNVEFISPCRCLDFEWIELLSNALQCDVSMNSLVLGFAIFAVLSFLLLRLLWPYNALLP